MTLISAGSGLGAGSELWSITSLISTPRRLSLIGMLTAKMSKFGNDLDGANTRREGGQNGSLVSGARSNFQYRVVRLEVQQICHQGDDEGQRYVLTISNRQGPIVVRLADEMLGNE